MGSIALWLRAIAAPLVKYVLSLLGFGLVTYAGFAFMHDQLASAVQTILSTIDPSIYQIVALAGLVDGLGIWMGALTTAAVVLSVKKLMIL